jgi:ribonuclease HI
MKELEIYIDGASKGNPGPSGVGAIISRSGVVIKNISSFIGDATNNIAEYTALIYALREAVLLKAESLEIKTDSQLLARQLNKIYKVKNANISGLYDQVVNLLASFKEVTILNIPREENKGADRLATEAVEKEFRKRFLL